jgi:hypothetical protein
MKITIISIFIALVLSSCVDKSTGVIGVSTGEKVVVRTMPSLDQDVKTDYRLSKGQEVEVLDESSNQSTAKVRGKKITAKWYKVRIADGIEGWVFSPFIDIANVIVEEEIYIPPPPKIYTEYLHSERDNKLENAKKYFSREWTKIFGDETDYDMVKIVEACDFTNPIVRNKASVVVENNSGSFNLGQICDIYDYCQNEWSYNSDPNSRDYYATASETIENDRHGDCDDFAILMGSMCIAVGGDVLINISCDNSCHAFSEIRIGKSASKVEKVKEYVRARYGKIAVPGIRKFNDYYYMNLDWFGGAYPGASYFNEYSIYKIDVLRGELHR